MRSQGVNATLWREVCWLVEEIVAAVFADAERIEGWDRRQAGELNRSIDLDVPTESGWISRAYLTAVLWRLKPF